MKDRVLAFDFGRKRIGTASGNLTTGTTEPLTAIACSKKGPNWARLVDLVDEWRAEELVVGLPLNMDGSESPISHAARRFGEEFARRTGLPVTLVDERLSSHAAEQVLDLGSRPGKSRWRRRRTHKDSLAAELILKTYLTDNSSPA